VDTDHIKRRIGRLDELSRGLAKEIVLVKGANDPLLYLERNAYRSTCSAKEVSQPRCRSGRWISSHCSARFWRASCRCRWASRNMPRAAFSCR
jgi:hypothetical protein